MNRCYDNRPMYASESSYNYTKMQGSEKTLEYPEAGATPFMGSNMSNNMMGMPMQMDGMMGCPMPPVYECPQERVVNREFVHNVEHIVPINTRVINHHVYRHTYRPCYTCCEENVCSNVYDNCSNNF